MPGAYSSAAGLLALLEEEDDGLRLHALKQLNQVCYADQGTNAGGRPAALRRGSGADLWEPECSGLFKPLL